MDLSEIDKYALVVTIANITTMSKLATPLNSPKVLLARVTRLTSTIPGLDASLMLAQYSSPLVIAFLLGLAKFRVNHPRLNTKAITGAGLIRLAEGWAKAAGSIGDARVIMRAFGKSFIYLTFH